MNKRIGIRLVSAIKSLEKALEIEAEDFIAQRPEIHFGEHYTVFTGEELKENNIRKNMALARMKGILA